MSKKRFTIAIDKWRKFNAPPLIVFDEEAGRGIRRGWSLGGEDPQDPSSYQRTVSNMTIGQFQVLVAQDKLVVLSVELGEVPEWYLPFMDFNKITF